MKLFNEYNNLIFSFLTNYINSCELDSDNALDEYELNSILSNVLLNSSKNIADAIMNMNIDEDTDSLNANLFYKNEEQKYVPIISNNVPVLTSKAERYWLSYILSDPKTALFLDSDTIKALQENIGCADTNPISDRYIDVRYPSGHKPVSYSDEEIARFRTILKAITEHRYFSCINTAFDGQIYTNTNIIPIRLEYDLFYDSFAVSALIQGDNPRPVKLLLSNLSSAEFGDRIEAFDVVKKNYDELLLSKRVKTPLQLIISNFNNGFDRAGFILSSYDRVSYRIDSDTEPKIHMDLFYYDFQENELIENLLFLGPIVKIISPDSFKNKFISRVKASLNIYK